MLLDTDWLTSKRVYFYDFPHIRVCRSVLIDWPQMNVSTLPGASLGQENTFLIIRLPAVRRAGVQYIRFKTDKYAGVMVRLFGQAPLFKYLYESVYGPCECRSFAQSHCMLTRRWIECGGQRVLKVRKHSCSLVSTWSQTALWVMRGANGLLFLPRQGALLISFMFIFRALNALSIARRRKWVFGGREKLYACGHVGAGDPDVFLLSNLSIRLDEEGNPRVFWFSKADCDWWGLSSPPSVRGDPWLVESKCWLPVFKGSRDMLMWCL